MEEALRYLRKQQEQAAVEEVMEVVEQDVHNVAFMDWFAIALFGLSVIGVAVQVYLESGKPTVTGLWKVLISNSTSITSTLRPHPSSDALLVESAPLMLHQPPSSVSRSPDLTGGGGGNTNSPSQGPGDTSGVTTAHVTRKMFRRILLIALLMRLVVFPWQAGMVGESTMDTKRIILFDTLPELAFGSAWILWVRLLIQLVRVASGDFGLLSPSAKPQGWLIAGAGAGYLGVLVAISLSSSSSSSWWWLVAYLLAWYAAGIGISVVFGPRLLWAVHPSLVRQSQLMIRLYVSVILMVVIFGGHVGRYASYLSATMAANNDDGSSLLLSSTLATTYLGLEWLPATAFAALLAPTASANQANNSKRSTGGGGTSSNGNNTPNSTHKHRKRTVSPVPPSSKSPPTTVEGLLLKPQQQQQYGATTTTTSTSDAV